MVDEKDEKRNRSQNGKENGKITKKKRTIQRVSVNGISEN